MIFCHCRENFPFDVVRGGKWGLWSKRCKHLFARRRTSGRLAKLECQGLVRFSAVRFTLPSSTGACSERREGQGRYFWAHHSPWTPSKGPSQVNKLVWESFWHHPSSTKAMGGNQIFVLGAFMFVPFGVTAIDLLSNNIYGHGTPTWEARKKVSWVLLQLFAPKVLRNSHPNTIPSIRLPYSSEWTKQA